LRKDIIDVTSVFSIIAYFHSIFVLPKLGPHKILQRLCTRQVTRHFHLGIKSTKTALYREIAHTCNILNFILEILIGCIQRIQQLSERLVIIACD